MFFGTAWALVPPLVAIGLALITKEVYSSLFLGILVGAALYSGFSFEGTVTQIFQGGIIQVLTSADNMGILIFLVILGVIVSLMNRAGGSAAFGKWAGNHIKGKIGAQLATIILGVLIFIDDYFNCLTVGSVMRPVTDRQKISREKLAYRRHGCSGMYYRAHFFLGCCCHRLCGRAGWLFTVYSGNSI